MLLHFTIMPGFLSSGRSIAMVGMFTFLFAALFMGIGRRSPSIKRRSRRQVRDQLNLARRIQRSFLLSQFPEMPRLEIHAVNISSKAGSGDSMTSSRRAKNAFLIAIADVAGKGVPAALLSSMLQASLRTAGQHHLLGRGDPQEHQRPGLSQHRGEPVRHLLPRARRGGQHAAALFERRAQFSGVFRKNGEMITLERGGTVVGILESADFEEDSIALEPGDRWCSTPTHQRGREPERRSVRANGSTSSCARSRPRSPPRRTIERIVAGVRDFLAAKKPATT